MAVIDGLRQESPNRTYCGNTQYSALLTIEQFAKKGVVDQVGIEWQEPNGWSFSDFETVDIVEPPDITATAILAKVRSNVFQARLQAQVRVGCYVTAGILAAFLLGLGIAWVRRGFAATGRQP